MSNDPTQPPPGDWSPPSGSVPGGPPWGPPQWTAPQFAPPYGYHGGPEAAPRATTNGLAIASMVLGILWLYWLGSLLAVVFGHVALAQINRTGQGGRGMAIAGLALGYTLLGVLAIVVVVAAAAGVGGGV